MKNNLQRLAGWFQARDKVETLIFILVLAAHTIYMFSSAAAVLDWYPSDDAFYYFKTAQNIAEGRGVTFDGITRTNGFHPLWMAVNVPVFALARFSLVLPLRVLILVQALLNAGSGILLYRLGKRFFARGVAAFVASIWLFTPAIHSLTARGGIEAGISAFFIFLLWERVSAFNQKDEIGENGLKQLAGLGLIGALTILSRLDNVFLVFFAGLWLWLRWRRPPGENAPAWGWRVRTGLAYYGPITVIMLAYLAWNYVGFGALSPISGLVKAWWGELEWTIYGVPVRGFGPFWDQLFSDARDAGPFSYVMSPVYKFAGKYLFSLGDPETILFRRTVVLMTIGLIGALLLILILIKKRYAIERLLQLGLFAFFPGVFFQYAYYYAAGHVGVRFWYWVIPQIWLMLLLLYVLGILWSIIKDMPSRWPGSAFRIVLLGTLIVVFVSYARYIWPRWDSAPLSEHAYIKRANWLEENTPPGAVIAASGSGSIGYFTQGRSIVNMDGLMNSIEYLEHMKAGTGADYLAEIGVEYVYGNQYNTQIGIPYGAMLNGKLEEFAIYKPDDRTPRRFLWRFVP